ncbi:MAG TPA: FG-GAP-like repeat-containing protein [Acidobacteriota bacterium]
MSVKVKLWSVLLLSMVTLLPASVRRVTSDKQRAKEYLAAGDYRSALNLLDLLTASNSGDSEIYEWAGLAAMQLQDYGPAAAYLKTARSLKPGDPQIRKLLAKTYLLAEEPALAQSELEFLITLSPKDWEAWSMLGRHYQQANRFDRAKPTLEQALRLNPGDVLALASLGYTYFGLGRNAEAIAAYRKAVEVNRIRPRPYAEPHASYGIILLRLDRPDEARLQIERAAVLDPQNKLVHEAQTALAIRFRVSVDNPTAGQAGLRASAIVPTFRDIARNSGLDFILQNDPTAEKHQIETMPGGLAVLDFDNDGRLDVYLTNGAESPSLKKTSPRFWNRLYRNIGNGRFSDATVQAGVQGQGYAMGAAAADFDNDGFTDLVVVGVNRNTLYRNNGNGTFSDVTRGSGLDSKDDRQRWGIHAAWIDYDNDGWLDLLLVNYCAWNPLQEPYCESAGAGRSYCHPSKYRPLPNQLFHNNRDGTFTDVSEKSGIGRFPGKGMGAAIADWNGDGLSDILVANDTEPNFLFWNKGDGKFEEIATQSGVAFNQFGGVVSSMGVDFRDFDNDGRPDLFVTDLSNEGFLLFRNRSKWFEDIGDRSGVAVASLPFSGWSNAIADFNNDGWKDLVSVNGHAIDNIGLTQSRSYKQRNTLYLNNGNGKFTDVSLRAGPDFQRAAAHRGAAVADFNNDGKMDLVVTALGDRVELFENTTPSAGHWLIVRLVGRRSNRLGLGAALEIVTQSGSRLWNHATTSVGYASSSDPRVHFGLGSATLLREVMIRWPAGRVQIIENVNADQILTVQEE